MKKSINDYIVLIITIIGSLASIISFRIYGPLLNDQGWIGVVFLGVLTLFFLGYNFYLISRYQSLISRYQKIKLKNKIKISRYQKKVEYAEKYAEIFQDINIAFSNLHSINREKEPTVELIIEKLSKLCDNISASFVKVYGENIGVCIKFLEIEDNRPIVRTLVRDNFSKTIQRKTGMSDNTKHWLDGNSDFEFIYSNFDNDNIDTSFYHEANLPICKDYKNTRLRMPWLPKQKKELGLEDEDENTIRRKYWPLKYRSTLVVPIVPILADEQNIDKLRGFLCVDSPKENMFNKGTDVHILRGISDGLYNQIDKLYQIIISKNE